MNNQRRKEIKEQVKALNEISNMVSKVIDNIDTIKCDEEEYRDNIPENMQASDRYFDSEEACDNMDDVISSLGDVIDGIEDAASSLESIV